MHRFKATVAWYTLASIVFFPPPTVNIAAGLAWDRIRNEEPLPVAYPRNVVLHPNLLLQ